MTDMLDLEINVVRSNVLLCLTAKKPIAQLPHSVDDELEETDIDLADEKNWIDSATPRYWFTNTNLD